MKSLSIYVHIPFCKSKCGYCDFLSFAGRDDRFEDYCKSLIKQIESEADRYKNRVIDTIFIGGGTPSLISSVFIADIMHTLFRYYNINKNVEITIEANPESLTVEKLSHYKSSGINRISLGVQSFNDAVLKRIGRVHNAEQAFSAYRNIRDAGFENVNIDIMFGLPHQSAGVFEDTLRTAVSLQPEHISCYGLIMEEGTGFYNDKDLNLPGEDAEFAMYIFAKRFLEQNGYIQYEISNYSKPGYQSKHNLGYWSDGEYAGFGLGAHSYIDHTRFHNTLVLEEYINGDFARRDAEELTLKDRYAEYAFLGMRKTCGIKESDFIRTFGVSVYDVYNDVIKKHRKSGLIEIEDGVIRLSEKGIYLSNIVFMDFLPD